MVTPDLVFNSFAFIHIYNQRRAETQTHAKRIRLAVVTLLSAFSFLFFFFFRIRSEQDIMSYSRSYVFNKSQINTFQNFKMLNVYEWKSV